MDFFIGLMVGLLIGGFVGIGIAALVSANDRNGGVDDVLDETIATLKKQSRTEKDTDTWESDMNRDAEQYKAGE